MTGMRRGWLHLASGAGVGRVCGFASNLLLSRWLGPTELGLFNLTTTTVQTADTLVRCGGDYALNFELGGLPEATKTDRGFELARGLVLLCSLTTAFICFGVFIWVWWGQGLFPSSLDASHRFLLTCLLLFMIACEGISSSAWEVLLVCHRTASLALRQGLFYPLRLLVAAIGSAVGGVGGAMAGWCFIALAQCIWLRSTLGSLWNPLHSPPALGRSVCKLLKRGLPFYASNLLTSLIFYPLLLKVASSSGLAEIGYLRVGQILQQLFAFVPATLTPVLFLRMRAELTLKRKVELMEMPLQLIWSLLLAVLCLYSMIDSWLIRHFFGSDYTSALLPTRLLLITALLECVSQLIIQPSLAAGHTRLYAFWQNGSAIFAATLGWLWIPSAGLSAYLITRLIYTIVPFLGFFAPLLRMFKYPNKLLMTSVATISLTFLFIVQSVAFIPSSVALLLPLIFLIFTLPSCLQVALIFAGGLRR